MPVLNIYSLDDTEYENVIASLSEGKHVIGRGDLLKVSDKRVSRKHAIIEVSSSNISLTSVHVNPCFFKAANGNTLTVLSSNQQSELNDGDQFALLPESCWFRVKVKWLYEQKKQANGDKSTSELNGKRCHDNNMDDSDTNSKRTRLSTYDGENRCTIENNATTSNITLELSRNDLSSDGQQENNIQRTSQNLAVNNGDNDLSREIKEEPTENDISSSPSPASHNVSGGGISDTVNTEIKQEINEEVPVNEGTGDNNPPDETDTSLTNQQPQIKTEHDDQNHENVSEGNIHTSQNSEQPVIKTENDNQNQDNASGSGNGPTVERRERCWYGSQCFRKNPAHRESFSHPGDQDYDSDPTDDRPNCPYGASCYRKNIDHRRQYKHVGKPAPKPSNVNVMFNVDRSCPHCEHCNRKRGGGGGGKPDYESDVDDDFY